MVAVAIPIVIPPTTNAIEARCESCRFWNGDGVLRGHGSHECLRRAPTEGREVGGYIEPRWPLTKADMWCGEFEPRRVEGGVCG